VNNVTEQPVKWNLQC